MIEDIFQCVVCRARFPDAEARRDHRCPADHKMLSTEGYGQLAKPSVASVDLAVARLFAAAMIGACWLAGLTDRIVEARKTDGSGGLVEAPKPLE